MIIKRGDVGSDVEFIQRKLRDYGYIVRVTGVFNLETEAAVRMFQRRQRVDIDGVAGPTTYRLLSELPELHINEPRVDPIRFVHQARYFSQRNNTSKPLSTCGPTSIAMVLDYLEVEWSEETQLEDQVFWWLRQPDALSFFRKHFPWAVDRYNPWNIAGMLKWVVEDKYGLQDTFKECEWDEIEDHLASEGPVIMSGRFTGSGHIIVVVGMTTDGDLICHDPYGNWQRGYHRDHNGAFVIYNKEDVHPILKPTGKKPWAHLIR